MQHPHDRFRDQRIHDVPFEHLETPSSNLDEGRPADQSTLTDHERKAFSRLFQSLAPSVDEVGTGNGAGRSFQNYNGEDYFDGVDELGTLEHILNGDSANVQDLGSPIERYPPALQNMAQQAEARMRLQRRSRDILQPQNDRAEADVDTSHPALVKERQEAKRIEEAMRAAETDHALWKILDEEVFANVRIIQADEDRFAAEEAEHREAEQQRIQQDQAKQREAEDSVRNEVAARGRTRKTHKNSASSMNPQPSQEAETDLEPSIQILDNTDLPSTAFTPEALATMTTPGKASLSPTSKEPLFTHYPAIYANLTSLALTLLTQRTAYTPLALALIPAIQRIGLTAYALCASTALYNALLAYQYRVFHASHAMLASLAEMDAAGVPVDAETLAIVERVAAYRAAARTGRLGGMAGEIEQLWGREEEGRMLAEWARRIQGRLERRAVEGVQRRKAVGELRGEGVFE